MQVLCGAVSSVCGPYGCQVRRGVRGGGGSV